MRHITLTLSAAALLVALAGFGTAQAMPLAAAPAPVVQTSAAPPLALAYYVHGGHRYYRRGYYHGGYYRGRAWRPGVGVVVGAPYYRYGSNARWCLNRYGRRYVCGYY